MLALKLGSCLSAQLAPFRVPAPALRPKEVMRDLFAKNLGPRVAFSSLPFRFLHRRSQDFSPLIFVATLFV
jgi:hypothetical protein